MNCIKERVKQKKMLLTALELELNWVIPIRHDDVPERKTVRSERVGGGTGIAGDLRSVVGGDRTPMLYKREASSKGMCVSGSRFLFWIGASIKWRVNQTKGRTKTGFLRL